MDECVWELERKGCLHLVLFKEEVTNSSIGKTPGHEWWKCVFFGDEEINVDACTVGKFILA